LVTYGQQELFSLKYAVKKRCLKSKTDNIEIPLIWNPIHFNPFFSQINSIIVKLISQKNFLKGSLFIKLILFFAL
jgi:hypothetical protein